MGEYTISMAMFNSFFGITRGYYPVIMDFPIQQKNTNVLASQV